VKALAVVQVDAPVSDAVLDALRTIEALLEVRLVKLPEGGF
jgi:D-3-phosphoglycerate dehydrogenase